MTLRRLITRLLSMFVIVGLTLATLAVAPGSAVTEMGDLPMSADMPCCPNEHKSKNCQDCPLFAMCFLKTAQFGPSPTEALLLRHAIRTEHSFIDDAPGAGLVRPPPDHPPRA